MSREDKLNWYRREFKDINSEIKNKKFLSYLDFLQIRNFKLQNSSQENPERVKLITKKAFDLAKEDKIKESISELLNLHGVRIPIASTILAMKFPDKYAIIDRIVLTNLDKKEWLKLYLNNPAIYEEYLILMRKNAKSKKMKLRDYELSLFEKGIN